MPVLDRRSRKITWYTRLGSHRDATGTVNVLGEDATRHDIPDHVRTHPKGILVGIFVACRVKNCQHLNRLRHDDEKRDYRPDADDSQLDTACRLSGVHGFRCMTTHPGPVLRSHAGGSSRSLSASFNERPNRSPRSQNRPTCTSELVCFVN